MKYNKIPRTYKIGGQKINVHHVERCDGNVFGNCFVGAGRIEIANFVNKNDKQSETSKINTFYHELVHSVLDTMDEKELSENEKFVCCFAGFLADAMENAYFLEEE